MMKYIDAHAHAYRKPLPFVTRFCTPDELIERYDRYGIEMGALLPVVNSEIYLPQANEDILDMAEAHPDRFFPFCNVDPRALINRADAQLDTVLQYYKDLGCKGVGEIMPNLPFEDELVQNLFRCILCLVYHDAFLYSIIQAYALPQSFLKPKGKFHLQALPEFFCSCVPCVQK